MKTSSSIAIVLASIILGIFFLVSVNKIVNKDRIVNVKGLAEREVKADLVIWPIPFKEIGDNIEQIYTNIEKSRQQVIQFLIENGIKKDEITMTGLAIYDSEADRFANEKPRSRYIATSVITVSSDNVDLVRNLIDRQIELLRKGVVISGDDYQYRVNYFFTGLNEIKPEMIEEATKNARQAAEKFASDSQSELGKIKTASQGFFTIDDRDMNTPYIKKVRVVTSVSYGINN